MLSLSLSHPSPPLHPWFCLGLSIVCVRVWDVLPITLLLTGASRPPFLPRLPPHLLVVLSSPVGLLVQPGRLLWLPRHRHGHRPAGPRPGPERLQTRGVRRCSAHGPMGAAGSGKPKHQLLCLGRGTCRSCWGRGKEEGSESGRGGGGGRGSGGGREEGGRGRGGRRRRGNIFTRATDFASSLPHSPHAALCAEQEQLPRRRRHGRRQAHRLA